MFKENFIKYRNDKIDLREIPNEIVLLAYYRASEYETTRNFEKLSIKDCFPEFLNENCGALIRKELKNLEQLKIQEQKAISNDQKKYQKENPKGNRNFEHDFKTLESKLRLFGLFIYNLEEIVGYHYEFRAYKGQGSPFCQNGENSSIWLVANGCLLHIQSNNANETCSLYTPQCIYNSKEDKKFIDQLFERDKIMSTDPRQLK